MFDSIQSVEQAMLREKYIPERSLATVLYPGLAPEETGVSRR